MRDSTETTGTTEMGRDDSQHGIVEPEWIRGSSWVNVTSGINGTNSTNETSERSSTNEPSDRSSTNGTNETSVTSGEWQ
ncbi:hypothetical protein [Natrialba sp. SSL1]|uniref:hypothetical protein n=1 Tax=Natrialba sp. SSL1 TaxID=1869245 RepID=UPI0011139B80|nr:hypothetical protein [Natrialba sp. SSL1]